MGIIIRLVDVMSIAQEDVYSILEKLDNTIIDGQRIKVVDDHDAEWDMEEHYQKVPYKEGIKIGEVQFLFCKDPKEGTTDGD